MQRTLKTTKMDVVVIDEGSPVIVNKTFATPHIEDIEKMCRKCGMLPMKETARRFDELYELDDETFFKFATLKSSTEIAEE